MEPLLAIGIQQWLDLCQVILQLFAGNFPANLIAKPLFRSLDRRQRLFLGVLGRLRRGGFRESSSLSSAVLLLASDFLSSAGVFSSAGFLSSADFLLSEDLAVAGAAGAAAESFVASFGWSGVFTALSSA